MLQGVRSLVRELRSCESCGVAKKKKNVCLKKKFFSLRQLADGMPPLNEGIKKNA